MECRRCRGDLHKPGDYCLMCHTCNTDVVLLDVGRERTTVTMYYEGEELGETTVTTSPDEGDRRREIEIRNFVEFIADNVRRKRTQSVYAHGNREVLKRLRSNLHLEIKRGDEDGITDSGSELVSVNVSPEDKIGGSHTTIIGEGEGYETLKAVTRHSNVKKLIPGPIDASGNSSTGFGAKVTRADKNGNLRLLIRDGSAVQENRIVTTAMGFETGESIRDELNSSLREVGLQ